MDSTDMPNAWAFKFGLAQSPLFGQHEMEFGDEHSVLLDGGYGSFALSINSERIWADYHTPADWSWSSDLPHHVTVTDREVTVVRWDKPGVETFTRTSIERQLEAFYGYLAADQVKSNQRVVEHMLGVFRSMRSLLVDSGVEDDFSVDAYLALLSRAMDRHHGISSSDHADHFEGEPVLQSLPAGQADGLLDVLMNPNFAGFTPHPGLAVRHAGSDIFQEAHFELRRVHGADLFGYAQPAESVKVTRGGAHYTPSALARSVVEQVLTRVPDLASRRHLTVLDPACGSGAFLHEALRTLRRKGFEGRIHLVGRDTSRPAVSMALFALQNALRDWSPDGGHEVDVLQADSLASPLPASDVILMNPPFVSWPALTKDQREHMQSVLGPLSTGRGDYSMAFVTHAIKALTLGGVMGTLLPSSLLVLDAAGKWRKDLLEKVTMNFMAALGDYGLFPYAQVQVAIAVLSNPTSPSEAREPVSILVTDNDHHATGNAMRALRKTGSPRDALPEESGWQMFEVSVAALQNRPTWRLVPPQAELAIGRLLDVGDALPAGALFNIHQGVRTGSNPAFLLNQAQLEALPQEERKWFRPAITNKVLTMSKIVPDCFVFYPYQEQGLAIVSEEELVRELPAYFEAYLEPRRGALVQRRSLRGRTDWWGLSWPRAWSRSPEPRIVSKFFGGSGAFAVDLEARHIVVQGYAWFPKWEVPGGVSTVDDGESVKDWLAAYVAIMNSTPFQRLLQVFSPHVSGGQFDLSPKYVKHIPVPNIPALVCDERAGHAVSTLAALVRGDNRMDSSWRDTADHLTAQLYGPKLLEHI